MLNEYQTELLTVSDTAKTLHVSRRTLSRWARLRKGPPRIKIGRTVFYRRNSLDQWLLSQEERIGE
uniref:helix-turn-helix transcriptional regulator n=1 Tax=uncultured Erythrobacter sp. TaxID=263913 RepID=UPI00345B74E3